VKTIVTRDRILYLISNLSRYPTLADLRASAFFADCHDEIDRLLGTAEVIACGAASPRLSSFIRVAQWNIEKGRRAADILQTLQHDPILQRADVILLNEADRGMNRSGNCHVAAVLADGLGMHMAFAPAHLELTKGTEDELQIEGENREGMQGNAVLSRYPIVEALVVSLPVCFDPFEFHEKRYGRRVCLWTRLKIGSRSAWIGSVHLEVRNSPRCRAVQIHHVLTRLPGDPEEPYLLGGDLNTNGFSRGTAWRALQSMARLVRNSPADVQELLIHPERGAEPLFRFVRQTGFVWEGIRRRPRSAASKKRT
jgi:endonuclease/exonuclease/phosphatase family metal-dependent hydrolase